MEGWRYKIEPRRHRDAEIKKLHDSVSRWFALGLAVELISRPWVQSVLQSGQYKPGLGFTSASVKIQFTKATKTPRALKAWGVWGDCAWVLLKNTLCGLKTGTTPTLKPMAVT
jgi:hypothetical protein